MTERKTEQALERAAKRQFDDLLRREREARLATAEARMEGVALRLEAAKERKARQQERASSRANSALAWEAEKIAARDALEAAKKKKRYEKAKKREAWILCEERCANFITEPEPGKSFCRCGHCIPPGLRDWPQPPEECHKFCKLIPREG